jgi:hypothetical protein
MIGSLSLVYGIAGSFEFQKITAGTDGATPLTMAVTGRVRSGPDYGSLRDYL